MQIDLNTESFCLDKLHNGFYFLVFPLYFVGDDWSPNYTLLKP